MKRQRLIGRAAAVSLGLISIINSGCEMTPEGHQAMDNLGYTVIHTALTENVKKEMGHRDYANQNRNVTHNINVNQGNQRVQRAPKEDNFYTVSYVKENPSDEITLPASARGKAAYYGYNGHWLSGNITKDGREWKRDYTFGAGPSRARLTRGELKNIKFSENSSYTLANHFPDYVSRWVLNNRFKRGGSLDFQVEIYGNKGDDYSFSLLKDGKMMDIGGNPMITEDPYMIITGIKLPKDFPLGEWHALFKINGKEVGRRRFFVEE